MSDKIMLVFGEDGVAREYDDTWDITIHCESEEEQKAVLEKLNNSNQEPQELSKNSPKLDKENGGLQPTCNKFATDTISRQDAIEVADAVWCVTGDVNVAKVWDQLKNLPSAQPTLCGYDIEHLILIANVLRKENMPPERITEVLTDIERIVSIVRDGFTEKLRKAVEQCEI